MVSVLVVENWKGVRPSHPCSGASGVSLGFIAPMSPILLIGFLDRTSRSSRRFSSQSGVRTPPVGVSFG